jgi:[CysO sulfur-carrier protein]-S-L-cysteine hydrolase
MIHLHPHIWDALCRHAQETFPDECCGIIVQAAAGDEAVRRITNIQDAMHAKDPHTYPRKATTAYVMSPKELLAVLQEVDSGTAAIKAFYHSHPNHDAYFSAEDKTQAMLGDEPSYPEAVYLVISLYERDVRAIRAYAWNAEAKDFVETELRTDV